MQPMLGMLIFPALVEEVHAPMVLDITGVRQGVVKLLQSVYKAVRFLLTFCCSFALAKSKGDVIPARMPPLTCTVKLASRLLGEVNDSQRIRLLKTSNKSDDGAD